MEMTYVLIAVIIIAAVAAIYVALKYPGKVVEWLVFAVSEAEKELGGGTGQLKLRKVYDKFIEKYPKLSIIVPFKTFSGWVDLALKEMKKQLETNPAVKEYIEG